MTWAVVLSVAFIAAFVALLTTKEMARAAGVRREAVIYRAVRAGVWVLLPIVGAVFLGRFTMLAGIGP